MHNMTEFMYKSQKKKKTAAINKINPKLKKELDESVINAIIEDERVYNDFKKTGMTKFLDIALNGYKPPSRQTVAKKLCLKY